MSYYTFNSDVKFSADIILTNTLGVLQGGTGTTTATGSGDLVLATSPTITNLNAGSTKITNLAIPTIGTDAASKTYVDGVAQGLSTKNSAVAATVAAGTLSSSFANGTVIDGVTLATGNRILIKNQVSGVENGIYIVNASGAPTRTDDFDTGSDTAGSYIFIETGSFNVSSGWVCTNLSPTDIVGTDAINFTQFSGAGQIIAGTGLSKSGNTLSLVTPVTIANGGTGASSYATNEVIFYNGSALVGATNFLYDGATLINNKASGSLIAFSSTVASGSYGISAYTDSTNSLWVGLGGSDLIDSTNSPAGSGVIYTPTAQPLILGTNSLRRLQIDSAGIATFYNTTASTTISTGGALFSGGVGVAGTVTSSTSIVQPASGFGAPLELDATLISGKNYYIFSSGSASTEGANRLIFKNGTDSSYPLELTTVGAQFGYAGNYTSTYALDVNGSTQIKGDLNLTGDLTMGNAGLVLGNYIGSSGQMYDRNVSYSVAINTSFKVMNKRLRASRTAAKRVVTHWYNRSTNNAYLNGITWSSYLSLFVAAPNSGNIQVSANGKTWIDATNTPGSGSTVYQSVAWGEELALFAMVPHSGVTGTQLIITSPDGLVWTTHSAGTNNLGYYDIAYSPELHTFIAVGDTTAGISSSNGSKSTNGTAWAGIAIKDSYAITWSPELALFVAVGNNAIYRSSNTTTWTANSGSIVTVPIGGYVSSPNHGGYTIEGKGLSIVWCPELYLLVVATGTNTILTSPDAINWTTYTISGADEITSVTWSQELSIFIAVDSSTQQQPQIFYSYDSKNWTSSFNCDQKSRLCWSPELSQFAATGGGGGILTSAVGLPVFTSNPDDVNAQITFYGVNNQAAAVNVNGLIFTTGLTRSFTAYVNIVVDATTDLFAFYTLQGIYNNNIGWYFVSNYIGNNTSVVFTITELGQVQYTSANYTGFTSLTMSFKATTLIA